MVQKTELVIVDVLLRAIERDEAVWLKAYEARIRSIRNAIERDDPAGVKALQLLLSEHAEVGEEVVDRLAQLVLDFVSSEISRFSSIRSSRELTEAEKDYGRNVLPELLASLRKLVSP